MTVKIQTITRGQALLSVCVNPERRTTSRRQAPQGAQVKLSVHPGPPTLQCSAGHHHLRLGAWGKAGFTETQSTERPESHLYASHQNPDLRKTDTFRGRVPLTSGEPGKWLRLIKAQGP